MKKNGTLVGIPPKCLKFAINESAPIITNIWNEEVVSSSMFPESLKLADVTPVYKKSDPTLVSNYRPISVLPTMSKVFERLMHHQVSEYIDKHLSPFCVVTERDSILKLHFCPSLKNGTLKSFRYN